MANRSKKTVLSVRISPFSKASLDVLAVTRQESLPDVIEKLLDQAIKQQEVLPPAFIRQDRLGPRGGVTLGTLMQFIWVEDQALFKLRLHLLEPSALNDRDNLITGTVFKNLNVFGGSDAIFDKKALEFVQESPAIPKISISLVRIYWPLLTDYARFLFSNSLKLSFPDYVDMLRKSGELDDVYNAL